MPIFLELTPITGENHEDKYVQKRMYRVENMHSFEDADVNGKDYTLITFDEGSEIEPIVVRESYMDIWETLNNLNMVKEVNEEK